MVTTFLKRSWTGWRRAGARDRSACPTSKDAVDEFKVLGRLKGQYVWGVIPSYPTAVRPCSLALAALPVTWVSIERLFFRVR